MDPVTSRIRDRAVVVYATARSAWGMGWRAPRDLRRALGSAARAEPPDPLARHGADDLCTCQSGPDVRDRCGYRRVADAVIELFNPPDDDAAESWVVEQAVRNAAAFVESVPCACTAGSVDDGGCGRCSALGRVADQPIER